MGRASFSSAVRAVLASALLALSGQGAWAQKEGPLRPVDINTATRTELMQIPKLGGTMAERIVAFRKANGPFRRVEEIMNVRGMGEKTFLQIRHHLTVGGQKTGPGGGK